jgi:hypothetical protein
MVRRERRSYNARIGPKHFSTLMSPASEAARARLTLIARRPRSLEVRLHNPVRLDWRSSCGRLITREGQLVTIAEDVGIHNAVDRVVDRVLMQERLPLSAYLPFVSGRTSYEIVQKAFSAGIPIVAAVSAPSSLAIESSRP